MFLSSERIWAVYLGLDASLFDGVVGSRKNVPGINVLYVGHLSKAKGAIDLLRAIPLVLSKHHNTRFQFAGDILKRERNVMFIDNPKNVEAAVNELIERESVRESVELLGIVTGKGKLRTFIESDILVLPSYSEGFPWVVLEAMLAGKAVVSTPVGALPEVFSHGRHLLFVEPGDVEGIAEAINRLIEDAELRESLGRTARTKIQQEFNLQNFADRLEMVFNSVLESEGS